MIVLELPAPRTPLLPVEREIPVPGPGQILLKISACGVCRTDLHVVDGDLPHPKPRIVPGHEIVGTVAAAGTGVREFPQGARAGVPWLGGTCGHCRFCLSGRENLCDFPEFTGYTRDGGYGEYTLAHAAYCVPLPSGYTDAAAAPLLCAGLIGYRAWKAAGPAERLGLYGFGAAAHIVCQLARHAGQKVYAFTRAGDTAAQNFALSLGAAWAGSSEDPPPELLDAAILFAPVGALVPLALRAVSKGGTVVLGGIHMTEIPAMPYEILWGERVVRSVANLTRCDAKEFMALAPQVPVETHVTPFPLSQANEVLDRLRRGEITGAAVLIPGS